MMNKIRKLIMPLTLISVPLSLIFCVIYDIKKTALITFFIVIIAILSFFLQFEHLNPKPRDIMPIIVLASICAVSRIIFAPFPNFKPITAIVIISGVCFGPTGGFITGAVGAFASNIYFGQGVWTPWQMYAWGLIGFIAGTLKKHRFFDKPLIIYIFGFLSSLAFGFILDSWYIVGFISPITPKNALAGYLAGFPASLTHAIATVIFLVPIYTLWCKKIKRIQIKFGIKGS